MLNDTLKTKWHVRYSSGDIEVSRVFIKNNLNNIPLGYSCIVNSNTKFTIVKNNTLFDSVDDALDFINAEYGKE